MYKQKFLSSLLVVFAVIIIMQLSSVYAQQIESEDNGAISTASIAPLNEIVTGSLKDSSDEDYYKITLPSSGNIDLNFNHSKLGGVTGVLWEIKIINQSQKVLQTLQSKGNEDRTAISVGLPSGTYFIQIKHRDYCDEDYINVSYDLLVAFTSSNYYEKEFNNNIDEPNNLELDKSYTGLLSSGDDEDYYEFKTLNNGNVELKFNHDKLPGVTETFWQVNIINQSGKVFQSISSNGNEEKKSINVGLPTGTYYISIKHRDYCDDDYIDVPYKLSVNFIKSEYYEKEFNNNIDEPNKVELNKSYSGLLCDSDDSDFYTFSTNGNGNIVLKFNHTKLPGVTETFWDIYITNYDEKTYQCLYSNGNEEKKSISVGLQAGTYYVQIKHHDWCSNNYIDVNYNFEVDFTKSEYYEKEFNNNIDEPNKIALNKKYTGYLRSSEDEDFYTFTSTSKGNASLYFNHNKLAGVTETLWQIDVINSSGKVVKTLYSNGNESVKSLTLSNLPAGKYYIQVKHYRWCSDNYIDVAYSLSINNATSATKVKK